MSRRSWKVMALLLAVLVAAVLFTFGGFGKLLAQDDCQSIEDCMAVMTDKHIRHLPVLEQGAIVGVISIGDVVKEIIAEQEFVINQLENYISGER